MMSPSIFNPILLIHEISKLPNHARHALHRRGISIVPGDAPSRLRVIRLPQLPAATFLSPAQLQDLVGRIALYPDDLLALILPASTTPLDIVKAQRFLTKYSANKSLKPDPSISQPVMNLLTYPDVVNMMGDDLDWTEALGNALAFQQPEVLDAIQVFRRKAQAAGNLKSDDKQVVVVKQETVQIVPAKPEVIYVPQYQPATVIVAQPAPVVTYMPTAYPVYYNPVATVAAAATVGYIAGATTAYGLNWYGGGSLSCALCELCQPHPGRTHGLRKQRPRRLAGLRQIFTRGLAELLQQPAKPTPEHRIFKSGARQQTSTNNQTQRQQSAQQPPARTKANVRMRQRPANNNGPRIKPNAKAPPPALRRLPNKARPHAKARRNKTKPHASPACLREGKAGRVPPEPAKPRNPARPPRPTAPPHPPASAKPPHHPHSLARAKRAAPLPVPTAAHPPEHGHKLQRARLPQHLRRRRQWRRWRRPQQTLNPNRQTIRTTS